jgi:beta-galactosidase
MRGPIVTLALLAGEALGFATPHINLLPRAHNGSLTPSTERWPAGLHVAVDYYPLQWPESVWESDISQMRDNNISYVRINEFDWSILEPTEGQYNFTLLDKTLELFQKYGIQAILGTPTAAPPNWLTQKYDVSIVDRTNTTLLFGSRRHYSPSSFDYRNLSQTITQKLAERYGSHSAVVAWQLDNEFGCHDTVRSYDHNAIKRFRSWLQDKYGTIENMNNDQGRVFWSAQYESFDAVQPPFLEVYTNNELHTLDWYTFSSDTVIDFAKEQATIIRQYSPSKAITTNMMMGFLDFDHHKFAREVGIDFATFDQYALSGPGTFSWLTTQETYDTLRTGLPDWQALHHALYRGVAGAAYNETTGPFGVMEMEPGMLNWEQYRVSPWGGMVRLWSLETFAASGGLVNYFRWRQVPYAQEQTLSGLHLSDYTADEGLSEVQDLVQNALPQLRAEVADADAAESEPQADVALVFDYASAWTWAIEPYSGSWSVKDAGYTDTAVSYLDLVYLFFSSLRRLGLSIDVIGPDQPLDGYALVVVPSMPIVPAAFDAALASYNGTVVVGPHTGSKTRQFATVPGLNPGTGSALAARLPLRVTRVETPPTYANSGVRYGGTNYSIDGREEWVACERGGNRTSRVAATYTSPHRAGRPAVCASADTHYVGFKPSSTDFLVAYLGDVASGLGLRTLAGQDVGADLGSALRLLRRGNLVFAFNYGTSPVAAPALGDELSTAEIIVGEAGDIPAAGVVVWKT